MAKEQVQRVLTPEEMARRKAAQAGDADPAKRGAGVVVSLSGQTNQSPVEGYARRVERASQATSPMMIDYDRDGYPDAVVGRSGRNFNERLRRAGITPAGGGQAVVSVPGRQDLIYGGNYSLGHDGYRQDQIGYRDRLRGRMAAAAMLAERAKSKGKAKDEDEEEGQDARDRAAEARLHAMAAHPVPSHGGTGVPGGMPGGMTALPDVAVPAAAKAKYTPTEQAIMAPRTIPPGQPRNPGHLRQAWAGTVDAAPVVHGPAAQGVVKPDGTFVAGGATPTEAEPEPEPGAKKEPAKPAEHKPAEHKPAEHKPAEHKPAEHKPAEHKPAEHKPAEKK
jgi:hypothetical protein